MWKSRETKLTIAAVTAFALLLSILTIQFFRVPAQRYGRVDGMPYPTQRCDTDWFPPRHWTRQPYTNQTHTGAHMYGTLETQHAIWVHQHPISCHDKKFLVYVPLGPGHGIGSVVHLFGIAVQAALNLDRILVLYPQPNYEWNNGKFCEGADNIDECYFEPLSSCTIRDAFGDMEVTKENFKSLPDLNAEVYADNSARVVRCSEATFGVNRIPALWRTTPIRFHELLQSGALKPNFYYWWRAQGTAYIMRPNLRTLREIARRRKILFPSGVIDPGTVSIHVRHGDKWKESKLANDSTFLAQAEALLKRGSGLQRKIFLSTEDPETVRFFSELRDWRVVYTNVTRDAYRDPSMSPEGFAAKIGWDEEFLNGLLNLELAIECDGFVGAISSNWNRLIDELRSTVRCKYDRLYVDVAQGFNVKDYNW